MLKLFALIFLIGMCSGSAPTTYVDANGMCTWFEGSADSSQGDLQIPLGEKEYVVAVDGSTNYIIWNLGYCRTAVTPNGGIFAVGAMTPDGTGEVRVFVYDEDTQQYENKHTLRASDGEAHDNFSAGGRNILGISDDGTWIVAGQHRNKGSAYIFKYNDVTLQYDEVQKLVSPDFPDANNFAFSVAITGDGKSIIVSQMRATAVSHFRYSDTTQQHEHVQTMTPSVFKGLVFGKNVAITADGATLAVVSQSTSSLPGELYIFRYDETTQEYYEAAYHENGYNPNKRYGNNMDISGDGSTIVVGATGYQSAGVAIVYKFSHDTNQLEESERLYGNPNPDDYFGGNVVISDDATVIAVGDKWEGEEAQGAAYVFQLNEDSQQYDLTQRIRPEGLNDAAYYGAHMGISGNGKVLIVNAQNTNTLAQGAGSVFVYPYDSVNERY